MRANIFSYNFYVLKIKLMLSFYFGHFNKNIYSGKNEQPVLRLMPALLQISEGHLLIMVSNENK